MYLIFDFDGTIIDSYDSVLQKLIFLADDFKYKKIKPEEGKALKELSSREVLQHLQIPFYKIPKLIRHVRKHLREEIVQLPAIPDLPNVLIKLKKSGFSLAIITSNSKENVVNWLKRHRLLHLFSFIQSESKFYSKKYALKKALKRYKIEKSHVVYIGDETRDIEAAVQNKVPAIAVTWGFNSEKALLKFSPQFVVRRPQDLLTACGLY